MAGTLCANGLYVSSFSTNQVLSYDSVSGVPLPNTINVANPTGLAFGPDGNLYIAGGGNTVYKYNTATNSLSTIGTAANGLANPDGIAFSGNKLFVADRGNNDVLEYNGSTWSVFASAVVSGGGDLESPTDVAFDSAGNVLVTSAGNNRVLEYDSSGNFTGNFVSTNNNHGPFQPSALAFGPDGNLYVSSPGPDSNNVPANQVLRYTGADMFDGAFVGHNQNGLNSPAGLLFDSAGNLYVASRLSNQIIEYDSTGAFVQVLVSNGPGAPTQPIFMALDPPFASQENPEPATWLTMAGGLAAAAWWKKRRAR